MSRPPTLTEAMVVLILEGVAEGESFSSIAERVGISATTVSKVAHGDVHRDVAPDMYRPPKLWHNRSETKAGRTRLKNQRKHVADLARARAIGKTVEREWRKRGKLSLLP
jgi:hypothetical protein